MKEDLARQDLAVNSERAGYLADLERRNKRRKSTRSSCQALHFWATVRLQAILVRGDLGKPSCAPSGPRAPAHKGD